MILDQLRELLEHLVTPRMAEPVIDPLELVQIGEDERERTSQLERARHLRFERVEEAASVDEPRQLVGDRLALHRMVQPCVLERDRSL